MFENLNKLQVKPENTAPFTIYQIEGEPVIDLAPATEANKKYFNKLLKRSRKNQRRIAAGNFSSALIAENRDNDRELYPETVIKGWHKVKDSNGNLVDPTIENFKKFIEALPDWLFDEMRNFATNPQNYIDTDSDIDVEETAKN